MLHLFLLVLCGSFLVPILAGEPRQPSTIGAAEANAKLFEHVRGVFDMAKNPRAYIVYLVLDQEGNRYPTFWVGRNTSGTVKIAGAVDTLEGTLTLGYQGQFRMQLTNTARKGGMEADLPGSNWIQDLGKREFTIGIETLSATVLAGQRPVGDKGDFLVLMDVTCRGDVALGKTSVPFSCPARMTFSNRNSGFTRSKQFPFPARELGLEGGNGGAVTATLSTASAMTTDASAAKGATVKAAENLGDSLSVDDVLDQEKAAR